MKIGGRLARNARFEAPTYRSRFSGFLLPSPCLWRELQNLSFSKVSKQVVMSFCVAGVALGNILTCLQKCRQSFCVTRAILLQGFQKMNCIFGGRHSTLNVSILILRGKRSTSDVSCCVFLVNPIVRAASSGGSAQNPWHVVTCHDTPHSHSTLHTLHFTLYTLHSTLHTLHFTLHTPHFTLYTLHFTLHTLHSTLYTLHSTLYTPHSTLHTLHSTLHTSRSTLHTLHGTLHTLHSTLYTLHSTLHTLHSTLYTLHFTLHTLRFTLHTQHSTLHTLQFTLYTLHYTLHTLHSTLYTPHSTFCAPSLPHSTVYSALVW